MGYKKLTNHFLLIVGLCILAYSQKSLANLTVGVAINDLSNPFFLQIVKGAKRKADELTNGTANILVVASDYSLDRQRWQLAQLVERNADIVVITAADQQALAPDIKQAIKQGTQVIAVDVAAEGVVATVATDNVKAGFQACKHLISQLGGVGKIAIINGPNVSAVVDRVEGCKQAIAQASGIQLLQIEAQGQGSQAGGEQAMKIILASYPDVSGVFAINDPSAIGAELEAQNRGKRSLVITSVDGAPIMQDALKNANALVSATAAQYPDLMAEKAVELGYQLKQGKKLSQQIFLIDPSLVNKNNLMQYKGWAE
ncbi:ABC transporter substrate-binding protein [Catenovulum agarivorans]|uniref:ABC transporter substrate-binding protein n=1 Tax=Catenovulum agarivorans TaxID=1172192 RepID=UPI0002D46614|nr:ABC transporter substrate-binding protein [Catenovulum agarivorans]